MAYETDLLPADPDALLDVFRHAEKPRDRHAIGTEWERAGLLSDTLEPVPFEGERSISALLAALAADHGYHPEAERPGGPVVALTQGKLSITLEPAAQLELSGAPLRTVHETAAEITLHLAHVDAAAERMGITFLGLGFHPFATHADLPWVPKARYAVMREYLPTRSPTGLDMMRRTQTVQTNLDFTSEADAMRKLVSSIRMQPVLTAMFANSPWVEGHATGECSHRASVWVQMDPDRSGLLPEAFHEAPSYQRYVDYALDVPMFIVKRKDRILPATHLTFRSFLRDGLEGERATRADWEMHLNTLFPEVRLKRTLELRGIDSQDRTLIPALGAVSKGLLYDETSLGKLEAMAHRFSLADVANARPAIARDGLRASLGGVPVRELAAELLELARDGLARIGDLDAEGRDETRYLEPLEALVSRGRCPADERLAHAGGGTRQEIVRASLA